MKPSPAPKKKATQQTQLAQVDNEYQQKIEKMESEIDMLLAEKKQKAEKEAKEKKEKEEKEAKIA